MVLLGACGGWAGGKRGWRALSWWRANLRFIPRRDAAKDKQLAVPTANARGAAGPSVLALLAPQGRLGCVALWVCVELDCMQGHKSKAIWFTSVFVQWSLQLKLKKSKNNRCMTKMFYWEIISIHCCYIVATLNFS